jgi:hypothetical protein
MPKAGSYDDDSQRYLNDFFITNLLTSYLDLSSLLF